MVDDIFSKGIGNKEAKTSLMPKPVVVMGKKADSVLGKAGTNIK